MREVRREKRGSRSEKWGRMKRKGREKSGREEKRKEGER